MILNGKRFERGFCPGCSKHRPVYEKDLDHPDVAAGKERRKKERRK